MKNDVAAFPYNISSTTITFVYRGQTITLRHDQQGFKEVAAALREKRWADALRLSNSGHFVAEWSQGAFTFKNNDLIYKGDRRIPEKLFDKIRGAARSGKNPRGLVCFWERLQKNPSYRSVEQLFNFLAHRNVSISEDGFILAFKGVRQDYKDAHSGTFLNTPGSAFEMARNLVSDDPEVACHEGFHVGDLSYARGFSARTVLVAVDPADVVCIPKDADARKMRCCRYKVLANYNHGAELPAYVLDESDRSFWPDEVNPAPEVAPDTAPEQPEDEQPEEETETTLAVGDEGIEAESTTPKAQEPKKKPATTPVPVAAPVKTEPLPLPPFEARQSQEWLDGLLAALETNTLAAVRTYGRSAGIANVNGIPGGKAALIRAIAMKVEVLTERKTGQRQTIVAPAPKLDKTKDELMAMTVNDLRKYAVNVMKIAGAGHIQGGKVAIVEAILKSSNMTTK